MPRKPSRIAAGAPAFRTLAFCAAVYLLPHAPAAAQIFGGPLTPTGSWLTAQGPHSLCDVFAPAYIRIEIPITATWSGSCSPPDYKASGMGTLIVTANGKVERYDGQMVAGMANGEGTLKAQDNITYTGHFKDGMISGFGYEVWPNGTTYKGSNLNGIPNGEGVVTLPTGDRYEGHLLNGKPDGHGVEVFANGARYGGEWRDGFPDGQGTMTKASGEVATGIWHHGCFHQGTQHAGIGVSRADCAKD